jgi:hypothetical protein
MRYPKADYSPASSRSASKIGRRYNLALAFRHLSVRNNNARPIARGRPIAFSDLSRSEGSPGSRSGEQAFERRVRSDSNDLINQCCKSIYILTSLRSYWVLLARNVAYHRPLPLMDASEAEVGDLRRAVLVSIAVEDTFNPDGETTLLDHVKWKMFQSPGDGPQHEVPYDEAWILLLRDGIHFLQKVPDRLLLRDVFAGTIVSSIPFSGEIYCIRHIHYNGRILVGSSYMLGEIAQ